MYPTHYLPLQSIGKAPGLYNGGFCRWWYIPIQYIASFPFVDPVTQQLTSEPILKDGKTWFGPVNVPDKYVGWKETQERSAAGIYYKERVQGLVAGIEVNSHINLGNHAPLQFCVVGKLRAGGFYIILGNEEIGLDFDHETHSGEGASANPGSEFVFSGEQVYKSIPLTNFAGDNSTPPVTGGGSAPGGSPGGDEDGGCCEPEIIFFSNKREVLVQYTTARKEKYGAFPSIEVWSTLDGELERTPCQIIVDALPPNQNLFTIRLNGPLTGFVRLS